MLPHGLAVVVDLNLCPCPRRTHSIKKWGEDLFTAVPPPVFLVQLLVREVSGVSHVGPPPGRHMPMLPD